MSISFITVIIVAVIITIKINTKFIFIITYGVQLQQLPLS